MELTDEQEAALEVEALPLTAQPGREPWTDSKLWWVTRCDYDLRPIARATNPGKARILEHGVDLAGDQWWHVDGELREHCAAPVPELRLVRDADCPRCEYPETFVAPERRVLGCSRCGWSTWMERV